VAERDHIAGLPVFTADAAAPGPAFEPGAPFWRAVDRLATTDLLFGQLDELLAGATSPRVWLLVHEPTRGELSATAALMLARALNGRGQGVLVLDVDEAGSALTIWAEREETEGWIDVARFGASVTTAAVPLPFRGGRGELLGVGSFTPTDASEDEIIALLSRLRHHADDIVLVGVAGPQVLPWARRAQRRLLCWDRAARAADRLAPLLGPFAAAGAPITALVAYGTAAAVSPSAEREPAVAEQVAEEQVANNQVAEEIAAAVPAVAEEAAEAAADATEAAAAEAATEVPAVTADEPVAPAAAAAAPAPERKREPVFGDGVEVDNLVETRFVQAPDSDLGVEPDAGRGTPRLFWLATAMFAVALVAVAWYWAAHVRVPRGGYFEPVVTQGPPEPAAADSLSSEPLPGAPADGQSVVADAAKPLAAADSIADGADRKSTRQVAQAGGLTSIGDTLPGAGTATGNGAAPAAARPTPAATTAPTAPVPFDASAYAVPAGQAGWALHVYSQADSASAAKQAAQLEREGYHVAVRIVEIKEKGGRWWRLYLGSFPSRAAARAAMPALLERLRASWAEPARIQD
jgi:hypothetical protein